MRKELPLGNQSLARIRGDNCVYVDKTSFAYQLLTMRQFVFLARPCRFGKTLFVDTLQEIAQGNRALFQGLYIYDRWDWSVTYPVVRIALQRADFPRLQVLLTALFAGIPYSHFVKNPMHAHEAYYATVLYAFLRSTRLPLVAEDFTNHGRADLTLFLPDKIYLFEFKAGTADALAQIHQRRYYEKYLDQEKAIYLVGINFSAAERNLAQLEWEVYKGK